MNADPDSAPSAVLDGDPVAAWLLRDARDLADMRSVIGELCQRLRASGFPLYRLFLSIRTLHPQVATLGYQWRRGDARSRARHRASTASIARTSICAARSS
jgi:hypothetical protein